MARNKSKSKTPQLGNYEALKKAHGPTIHRVIDEIERVLLNSEARTNQVEKTVFNSQTRQAVLKQDLYDVQTFAGMSQTGANLVDEVVKLGIDYNFAHNFTPSTLITISGTNSPVFLVYGETTLSGNTTNAGYLGVGTPWTSGARLSVQGGGTGGPADVTTLGFDTSNDGIRVSGLGTGDTTGGVPFPTDVGNWTMDVWFQRASGIGPVGTGLVETLYSRGIGATFGNSYFAMGLYSASGTFGIHHNRPFYAGAYVNMFEVESDDVPGRLYTREGIKDCRDGEWHHGQVVCISGTNTDGGGGALDWEQGQWIYVFVDGDFESSGVYHALGNNPDEFACYNQNDDAAGGGDLGASEFGHNTYSLGHAFSGLIGGFRIRKGAFNVDETTRATTNFGPQAPSQWVADADTHALYRMDESTGLLTVDEMSANRNGELGLGALDVPVWGNDVIPADKLSETVGVILELFDKDGSLQFRVEGDGDTIISGNLYVDGNIYGATISGTTVQATTITGQDITGSATVSGLSVLGATVEGRTVLQDGVQVANEDRLLTAGTGLTGGGDLSADRTFDVDFTAVQASGNYALVSQLPGIGGIISSGRYVAQFTATESQQFNHALSGYPQVSVLDSTLREIEVAVQHTDIDNLTITFHDTITDGWFVGDVSTGTDPAQFALSGNYVTREEVLAQYALELDEAPGSITYIGEAVPGTPTSAASWRIKRLDESDPVVELIITWADGNDSFDNIWDNRAALSYS